MDGPSTLHDQKPSTRQVDITVFMSSGHVSPTIQIRTTCLVLIFQIIIVFSRVYKAMLIIYRMVYFSLRHKCVKMF